ncbi:MAG TPA: DUF1707 domain-containing protein [Streptosporangiaceae bacterium]
MRAADADRDRVTAALREEMAVGRITMEEFEERLSGVYAAKTWDDLRALTSDLPVNITFDGEVNAPAAGPMRAPQAGPPMEALPGRPPMRRGPHFAPFMIIPLIGLGIAVAHGAFGALIPIAVIVFLVLGGIGRGRRRYHYRTR